MWMDAGHLDVRNGVDDGWMNPRGGIDAGRWEAHGGLDVGPVEAHNWRAARGILDAGSLHARDFHATWWDRLEQLES
jgi:hypothetical protein